jgi:hypothetical protein
MTAQTEVADFLLADQVPIKAAIDRLDFWLEDFHVDPEGYREIGHKVRSNAVRVIARRRGQAHGAGATYTALMDKISVSDNLDLAGSIADQSLIIHEVTHALMDYHRYRASDLVQEVAAYVAGGLYARCRAMPGLRANRPEEQAILTAAQDIVTPRVMMVSPGTRLRMSDPDVQRLAAAIRGSSIYPDVDAVRGSDGISGGLVNPWYLPRHGP